MESSVIEVATSHEDPVDDNGIVKVLPSSPSNKSTSVLKGSLSPLGIDEGREHEGSPFPPPMHVAVCTFIGKDSSSVDELLSSSQAFFLFS